MNCEKGDLAVVVHGTNTARVGTLCEVLDVLTEDTRVDGYAFVSGDGPRWLVQWLGAPAIYQTAAETKELVPLQRGCCPDTYLRPIRDNDGVDESFSWAGIPFPHIVWPVWIPMWPTWSSLLSSSRVHKLLEQSSKVKRISFRPCHRLFGGNGADECDYLRLDHCFDYVLGCLDRELRFRHGCSPVMCFSKGERQSMPAAERASHP